MVTVMGEFDSPVQADAAAESLIDHGLSRDGISLLAGDPGREYHAPEMDMGHGGGVLAGAARGATIGGGLGLAGGVLALLIPGVGPVIFMGAIAAVLIGGGVGGAMTAIIGALTNMGVPEYETEAMAEHLRRGRAFLICQTDDATADLAESLMRARGAARVTRAEPREERQTERAA